MFIGAGENAAPHLLGGGATPSAMRKPSGGLSTPFAPKSSSKFGDLASSRGAFGCGGAGNDLSTPAAGKKHGLSASRPPLGDLSNRKKPTIHAHITSKPSGAVQDPERLADSFLGISVTSCQRGNLFEQVADLPPLEYATRHCMPAGHVGGFDRPGFDVERAVSQHCQMPSAFGSPYVSTASAALQQPPPLVEMPSPAMPFARRGGGGSCAPGFAFSTAISADAAAPVAMAAPAAALVAAPEAPDARWGGVATAGPGMQPQPLQSHAETPPPMTPPEVELDLSELVAAPPCMEEEAEEADDGSSDDDSGMDMDMEDLEDAEEELPPPPPPSGEGLLHAAGGMPLQLQLS